MDVIERLSLEAAQADTMLAREHRHRYEFAAPFCAGLRVVDLCCGSGYGSAILAEHAAHVTGVEIDRAVVETARVTVGRTHPNTEFTAADAVDFLRRLDRATVDAVVCFEGLEHLPDLEAALGLLRRHAEDGLRVIASVPNSRTFHEENPFHLTDFGYEEAIAAFRGFPQAVMVPQYLAEGSVIAPPGAEAIEASIALGDRDEPEYANHFIFCIGIEPDDVLGRAHGSIQVSVAPLFNRWSEGMKHALAALRRENARLLRGRLGKSGSAAATALARISDREQRVHDLELRLRAAEARVAELEQPADGEAGRAPAPEPAGGPAAIVAAPAAGAAAAAHPGEDPNSWEMRRRRAEGCLLPWVESAIELRGRTVLEYGCGNAAVSVALAPHVERLIGLDIDPTWIEYGRRELTERGIANVELQLHPPEAILGALAAHRGEVDVLLLAAVLEHLTVAERLALLRLAREVVRPGGAIVVSETPNRLTYFDHHTAQMPFFHLLPDELALDYRVRSHRTDFRAAVDAAEEAGRETALEALARWGRGVSFHEFELVFETGLDRHAIAGGYDMRLFGERPVVPEERILARYLDRVRPDLPAAFSRQWIDVILSPQPLARRPLLLRPWPLDTTASRRAAMTASDAVRLGGRGDRLVVELAAPAERVVVGLEMAHDRGFTLTLSADGVVGWQAEIRPQRSEQVFVEFDLAAPRARLELEAGEVCEVVLVAPCTS